jgi:hypothetical protein
VNGVAQRVENRGVAFGDGGIDLPDVLLGDEHELGEAAVQVDADNFQILAEMRIAHLAGAAVAAIHVHFRADEIAGLGGGHVRAHFFHYAAKFVAERHRRMNSRCRPGIPAVNVQVGAADRRGAHPDQHFRWARHRDGHGFELRASFRAYFAQRFHGSGRHGCTTERRERRQLSKW